MSQTYFEVARGLESQGQDFVVITLLSGRGHIPQDPGAKAIVTAAGLGSGRKAKFHKLRRCAASHYAARGGNPTLLLDHSSPKITKAYLDPRYADLSTPACHVLPTIHRG